MNSIGPYYVVKFSSQRTKNDESGYADMAEKMAALVKTQKGFLGYESFRDEDGFGTTTSYWQSLDDIKAWRNHPEHLMAQELGRTKWYLSFSTTVDLSN